MPLTEAEQAYLFNANDPLIENSHQRLDLAPSTKQKIGQFTIVCLILNRTIGSGIFSTPHRVLGGTGSVGGFFLIWLAGAAVSLCGLYVWLECGLSMPQKTLDGEDTPRGVPRSGGEKNWLETMFPNPKHRTTCCYSIMAIVLYNLSGNAIALGVNVMVAAGTYKPNPDTVPDSGMAAGIAVAALSLAILLHIFSRRGGILVNNAFAVIKVLLLLAIIGLGIAKAAGRFSTPNTNESVALDNFTRDVWSTERKDISSYSNSLVLCMYTFSGIEQPFYVLAETKSPRRSFPKATVYAMWFSIVLFMLVNVAYMLVVPKSEVISVSGLPNQTDLATLFFQHIFTNQDIATRAMSGIIAFSIFGNIVVMTFTAARLKQEIAKEGILPWSLMLATSHSTPYGLYKRWRARSRSSNQILEPEEVEQSPIAAFILHWFSSVFLILVTLPIKDPRTSYYFLVALYSYVILTLVGFWVSGGLLWTKLGKSHLDWKNRRRYRPWMSPVHAIIYAASCLFILITAFAPPSLGSPYHESVIHLKWYLVPSIGLSAPLWGLLWYFGLLFYQKQTRRQLTVTRTAYIVPDEDCEHEYLQKAEIIDHSWLGDFGDGHSAGFKLSQLWQSKRTNAGHDQYGQGFEQRSDSDFDMEGVESTSMKPKDKNRSHPLANDGWRQYGFAEDDDAAREYHR